MACQLSPHTQCPNFITDYHKNILYRDGRKYIYIIKKHIKKNIYIYIYIIESVDSISRDERDVPLTQYITNT